jgi:hypothetical protein
VLLNKENSTKNSRIERSKGPSTTGLKESWMQVKPKEIVFESKLKQIDKP